MADSSNFKHYRVCVCVYVSHPMTARGIKFVTIESQSLGCVLDLDYRLFGHNAIRNHVLIHPIERGFDFDDRICFPYSSPHFNTQRKCNSIDIRDLKVLIFRDPYYVPMEPVYSC